MIFRANSGPVSVAQKILVSVSMVASVALIGCGGGGGTGGGSNGGGGTGDCGSASTSTALVACGFVKPDGAANGVNGLVLELKTAGGAVVAAGTTIHDPVTGQDGYFKITVPSNAATFDVSFAGASGYLVNYLKYKGSTYDITRPASAGGACIPALVLPKAAADNFIGTVSVFADSGPPPSPVFTCPR